MSSKTFKETFVSTVVHFLKKPSWTIMAQLAIFVGGMVCLGYPVPRILGLGVGEAMALAPIISIVAQLLLMVALTLMEMHDARKRRL